MNKNNKNAFTLVELLAVIVILAIILVIAVPKIMSVIEEAKKATLESTVKMIATEAEKARVQNTLLGNNKVINCKDIVQINDIDYERCIIEFDSNNNALVTIKGSGKFDNLNVCGGDKTSATTSNTNCTVSYGKASTYIEKLEAFNGIENKLEKKSIEYNGTTYDAGIRYVGATGEVKNQVYFNCEPTDGTNVYGSKNYNYASSCEIWRIIGVFEIEDEGGKLEKRVKLINTASTFKASWDSSLKISDDEHINFGWGINQWGESTYEDGSFYEGADLMRLLNGYYIGKNESNCVYCTGVGQATCEQTCTSESLKVANMKVLTSESLKMIDNAIWDTYGIHVELYPASNNNALNVYLQEKGISNQYKTAECSLAGNSHCNDNVVRTTSWKGLVGLMSASDITYADGWLYNQSGDSKPFPWSLSPCMRSETSRNVWVAVKEYASNYGVPENFVVWPSVYLSSNVEIIGGDGSTSPYKLSV